jgi:OFA family oxalate/formate antiporter-like MFS transporter
MKRWLVLIASVTIQSCLGVVYAWSTFLPALNKEHAVHAGQAGLIFGICIASFTVCMIGAGILQHKYGPQKICMIGGLLFLTGYLTGSTSNGHYPLMIAGFGLLAGAGIGFGYVCPLATGIKWFPNHKGLITGLTVAGFGLGSVFFAKAGQQQLHEGLPVLHILRNIGVTVGITVSLASFFLFLPDKYNHPKSRAEKEFPLSRILKATEFQMLFTMIFCGTFGGLLVIGNLKPIGISISLSTEQATFAIMLFAIGNALGRLLWGILYDRFGSRVIIACLLLLAGGAAVMAGAGGPGGFYTATLLIAFAFGGYFVLFAARVADAFGGGRIGEIYPFVFLGYGIAGLTGPAAGGWILHHSGSPAPASMAVVAVALTGSIIAWRYCSKTISVNS